MSTISVNLATNRGFDELLKEIEHQLCNLPHIGASLPRTWVQVREVLERDSRNYIQLEEFLVICERYGFKEHRDKLQLSGYLHDLGVCLHFQNDSILKKTIILKPKWGTDAVYKVLDNKKVIQNLGRFSFADLEEIWHESEYATMQGELLQLMRNFRLCYELPGASGRYIAPQLLSDNQPSYIVDESGVLQLRYTYPEFMPKGILTQFIVATSRLILGDHVWKSGVVLERESTRAEVLERYNLREVGIRVTGQHKKELMTIVAYELDRINESYSDLQYDKLIPCNCAACRATSEPYFYRIAVLLRFMADGQSKIQCQKSYEMVEVRSLIDDVLPHTQLVEPLDPHSKLGNVIFSGHIEQVIIGEPERGAIPMQNRRSPAPATRRSAWASGSFYLFAVVIVLGALGVLANTVPPLALPALLIAGVIFIPVIGALQLRQDEALSEKSFLELMKLSLQQLPLIGKRSSTREPDN